MAFPCCDGAMDWLVSHLAMFDKEDGSLIDATHLLKGLFKGTNYCSFCGSKIREDYKPFPDLVVTCPDHGHCAIEREGMGLGCVLCCGQLREWHIEGRDE